ncbi:MAG: hypothetical protein H6833_00400 [Planctomycetes bacterium]|nr:hypothetical protein [Planctomycetota bacterium]
MAGDEITVYDKLGRAHAVDREAWRNDLLPKMLAESWDSPDELRIRLRAGLRHGLAEELIAAAERLVAIDDDVVAAACIYSEVQRKSGNDRAALLALEDARKRRPDDPEPIVALALFEAQSGNYEKERDLLLEALELDANHDHALTRLLELVDDEQRSAHLERIGSRDGAWFARAIAARDLLDSGDVDAALRRYRDLLRELPRDARAHTRVTGDLGECGRTADVVAWFAADFDAETDGVYAGLNIVQSLIAEGEFARADTLLDQLFELEAPQVAEHLSMLDAELRAFRSADLEERNSESAGLQLAMIDGPIWAHGLQDTVDALPALVASTQSFLFLGLVDTTQNGAVDGHGERAAEQFEPFSRALPLYLAEALRFTTDARPVVLIPGIPGVGPVLPRRAWDLEALRRAVVEDGLPELCVSGALTLDTDLGSDIDPDGGGQGNISLVFMVHDVRRRTLLDRFVVPVGIRLSRTMPTIERELVDRLERLGLVRRRRRTGIWQRPRADECEDYATAIEMLLRQAFVSNEWLDRRTIRDEARIYQSFFSLCERMPGARVAEAMLLRSLVEGCRYRSKIVRRFVEPMREALAESLAQDELAILRMFDSMLED